MKILITHIFAEGNKGDASILHSQIESFKKAYSSIEIKTVTTTPQKIKNPNIFYSFLFLGFYKPGNLLLKIIRSSYILIISVLWAIINRFFGQKFSLFLNGELQSTLCAYEGADAIVPVGGGYLTGRNNFKGTLTVVFQMHAILIPLILKKPVFLYSQSIGPFSNRFQEYITKLILNRVERIYLREDISKDNLLRIGINNEKLLRAPDSAFAFVSDFKRESREIMENSGVDFSKKTVGVTVRNFLKAGDQYNFERSIANLIRYLREELDFNVLLITHASSPEINDDDGIATRRVLEMLKDLNGISFLGENMTYPQVRGIYYNLDYLVGTRMHSCIFALASRVPLVSIEYEYKTRGIMNDFGLTEWVLPMNGLKYELLRNKFTDLISKREEFLEKIDRILPDYQKNAERPAFEIVEYIKSNK